MREIPRRESPKSIEHKDTVYTLHIRFIGKPEDAHAKFELQEACKRWEKILRRTAEEIDDLFSPWTDGASEEIVIPDLSYDAIKKLVGDDGTRGAIKKVSPFKVFDITYTTTPFVERVLPAQAKDVDEGGGEVVGISDEPAGELPKKEKREIREKRYVMAVYGLKDKLVDQVRDHVSRNIERDEKWSSSKKLSQSEREEKIRFALYNTVLSNLQAGMLATNHMKDLHMWTEMPVYDFSDLAKRIIKRNDGRGQQKNLEPVRLELPKRMRNRDKYGILWRSGDYRSAQNQFESMLYQMEDQGFDVRLEVVTGRKSVTSSPPKKESGFSLETESGNPSEEVVGSSVDDETKESPSRGAVKRGEYTSHGWRARGSNSKPKRKHVPHKRPSFDA